MACPSIVRPRSLNLAVIVWKLIRRPNTTNATVIMSQPGSKLGFATKTAAQIVDFQLQA